MTNYAQEILISDAGADERATYRKLIRQMPLTLRPELNSELAEWETLFPFERSRIREFMRGVQSFTPSTLAALTEPLRKLEQTMGVDRWDFSEETNTLENASLLARSAYYVEWRKEVQRIYLSIVNAAHSSEPPSASLSRIVVVVLPQNLPYEHAGLWDKWGGKGVEVSIHGDPGRVTELLLRGMPSVPELLRRENGYEPSDLWLIDAEQTLTSVFPDHGNTFSLNVRELQPLRERVLERVNTIPKNIVVSDATLASIRKTNWDAWWPNNLAGQPSLRRFVIDLYLSGNGALVFSNAFVQWASSEAIRRARPRVLFARFGIRAKPKPFTSIAIFENQSLVSTLPDVPDPQGSAVDASILARYIFLSVERYPESQQTAFLCLSESARSAYLIFPKAYKDNTAIANAARPEQIADWMTGFLAKS